jgi:hypothetical protein
MDIALPYAKWLGAESTQEQSSIRILKEGNVIHFWQQWILVVL